MSNRNKLLPLFFALFLWGSTTGQEPFNGMVTDKDNGNALEAVLVVNVTDNGYAYTDETGRFILNRVSVEDTLIFHHLGYAIEEVVVEDVASELKVGMTSSPMELDQVVIMPRLNTLNSIVNVDVQLNPVKSSQGLMTIVPGLFIGQHAGGGKAEQIFLRGFDLDHGTDIQVTADGIPVNMVSQAHGQGYADLHFVIPELVENIDFGKGPYRADKGNFATAGFINFKTYDKLHRSLVKVEAGRFDTQRMVGLFDLLNGHNRSDAYIAGELFLTDGPFESPQHLNRLNLMGKFFKNLGNGTLKLTASHFQNRWDGSGQIPSRAVRSGQISRFGAIDDTEGGETERTNVLLDFTSILSKSASIKAKFFYSRSDFDLFSNFTFFLDDPINGDQIRQHEKRNIYGLQTAYFRSLSKGKSDFEWTTGFGFQYDDVKDSGLFHTADRTVFLDTIAYSDIYQVNTYFYSNLEWQFGKWMINPGLRFDLFQFEVVDKMQDQYRTLSREEGLFSPKLNIVYKASDSWQLYAKSGFGLHSNDARLMILQPTQRNLQQVFGFDVGAIVQPFPNLYVDIAGWYLLSSHEHTFSGDSGEWDSNGRARRLGIDLGLNYQITDWLYANVDFNYAVARSLIALEGRDYLPLSVPFSSLGSLTYRSRKGFSGRFTYRYLHDRPANESNTIKARGYFINDLSLFYEPNNLQFGILIQNLFNQNWETAQFLTESRLATEQTPVEEIHFTPGTPFFIRGLFGFRF